MLTKAPALRCVRPITLNTTFNNCNFSRRIGPAQKKNEIRQKRIDHTRRAFHSFHSVVLQVFCCCSSCRTRAQIVQAMKTEQKSGSHLNYARDRQRTIANVIGRWSINFVFTPVTLSALSTNICILYARTYVRRTAAEWPHNYYMKLFCCRRPLHSTGLC